ncbi:hypothetical protein SDJN03_10253, partial [Cucurbita argyrosperma subsp. sororia]
MIVHFRLQAGRSFNQKFSRLLGGQIAPLPNRRPSVSGDSVRDRASEGTPVSPASPLHISGSTAERKRWILTKRLAVPFRHSIKRRPSPRVHRLGGDSLPLLEPRVLKLALCVYLSRFEYCASDLIRETRRREVAASPSCWNDHWAVPSIVNIQAATIRGSCKGVWAGSPGRILPSWFVPDVDEADVMA